MIKMAQFDLKSHLTYLRKFCNTLDWISIEKKKITHFLIKLLETKNEESEEIRGRDMIHIDKLS